MTRRPRSYVTRPAICLDRLAVREDGKLQYELKNPFSDGTTHILFSPLDFLSKLAAQVPRPRHNLVRYHGVFARDCHQYNAKIRKLIVPKNSKTPVKKVKGKGDDKKHDETGEDELVAPLTWAQRLKRVFNMMGPPSDYRMPSVQRYLAYHCRNH
ncbi:MAG: transposase [Pseudomonadales bacterium]|nr:transposase [Pseudomonadales bacterium]